jgi:hypothetical protein
MEDDETDEKDFETCPATTKSGDPCGQPAGWGTDSDAGPCKFHGGAGGDVGDPGGAPEDNENAETHGLTADRDKWFDRHREEVSERVRALTASYVRDAPFGWDAQAKVDQVVEVAIDQTRLRHSNDVIDGFLKTQVVGTRDDGSPIRQVEEHPGHLPRDRIKRTNLRVLKDLGILDDPDSAQADATKTIAEVLANE